ncbi:PREDICTED: uncharacterized protein LOC109190391 [Ipomoea nil]|uniref:uncharacterized protein LOC109190391 n=1 Tax=Ipomoea nil TaxID=35883 RepID=UPI000901BBD6|nr:PREDICTED: uncharacterized protein LOC109190391 [Ipomoea nil]
MKTKGRRRLFKCLEPLVGTFVPGKSKRSGVDGTKTDDCSLGSGCGGDVIAGFLNISSPFDDRKYESSDGGFAKESREKSGRSFSRVIKSILFEKSLMRKFRKKGSSSPSTYIPSTTSCESSPETYHKTRREKRLSKETWGTDESLGGNSSDSSDTASRFSSSTAASTSRKSSRSVSERKFPSPRPLTNFIAPRHSSVNEEASFRGHLVLKPPRPSAAAKEPFSLKPARTVMMRTTTMTTKRYHNSNVMMCFIVLSLMALVFWGKILAIVCTSAWLYMVPRSSRCVAHSPEIYSGEVYSSKIVKERMSEQISFSRRLGASN